MRFSTSKQFLSCSVFNIYFKQLKFSYVLKGQLFALQVQAG